MLVLSAKIWMQSMAVSRHKLTCIVLSTEEMD